MPITTNGIVLNTLVLGEGPAVVLVHGFPELAYSWRHQVPELVAAGYRVIVPDMRGYGGSCVPAEVDAYRVSELAADLTGLLDALGETRAVFVGHDWGASVVWHVAATHADRVRAVAGLSVPYAPPAPAPPTEILLRRLGETFYMLWFQQVGPADEALAADVRRTMTAAFASSSGGLTWRPGDAELPGWISPAELEVYVESFTRTGFSGGLNYYRNLDRNWRLARRLGSQPIKPPALYAAGTDDPVAKFMPTRNMAANFADLRKVHLLDGAGHWIQQERPAEINLLLLEFLAGLPRAA